MPTIFDDILITEEKRQSILDKAPDKMPLNPTAQGWSGQQVRAALTAATFGSEDSLLSEVETKLNLIKDHFESAVGNFTVLDALPVDLAPYEGTYIFIKDSQENIVAAYHVKDGVALKIRFATNLVVQDEEPVDQIVGDLWYDIISGPGSIVSKEYLSLEGGDITGHLNVSGNVGVGTLTPSEKLEVVGNAKVSGTITSNGNGTIGGTLTVGSTITSNGNVVHHQGNLTFTLNGTELTITKT